MTQRTLNLAIIGCGAMTQSQHLPRLVRRDNCRVTALVDANESRAAALAKRFGVPAVYTDYRRLLDGGIDGAIVVLPNHLHAPVSAELLAAGIGVLVEKPMARTTAECNQMLAAAAAGRAVLAVGLMRRFSQAGRFARWAIQSGLLGRVTSFEMYDGFVYAWPVASDFFLRRDLAGGGVLIDLGAHTVDQMLWWLGDVESFEYYDDNYGGVEADAELRVQLKSGAAGRIELSRTRDLSSRAIIRGDRAELEVALVKNSASLRFPDGRATLAGHVELDGEPVLLDQRPTDLVAAEQADFLAALRGEHPPLVSGQEGRRSIALIEACYARRCPLPLPWVELPVLEVAR